MAALVLVMVAAEPRPMEHAAQRKGGRLPIEDKNAALGETLPSRRYLSG